MQSEGGSMWHEASDVQHCARKAGANRLDPRPGLSQRSATTGSTRMARRAGIAHPSKPERMSTAVTQMKVSGSRGTLPQTWRTCRN